METLWESIKKKTSLPPDSAGPADPAQRWEFSRRLTAANLARQKTIARVGLALLTFLILYSWYKVEKAGGIMEPSLVAAQVLRAVWLACLGAFLFVAGSIPPAKELSLRYFVAERAFLVFNLILAAGQVVVTQPAFTGISIFIITVFTMAAFLRYPLPWTILGLGGAGFLISVGVWFIEVPGLSVYARPLSAVAMLALALVTMRLLYKKEVNDYLQLKVINRQSEMLERLSLMDDLTGLLNKRCLDEFLPQEWRRCAREKVPLAVIAAGIDHFKNFNETMGRQAGNECLKIIGSTLNKRLGRGGDQAARYGDDEFLLVLPGANLKGGTTLAAGMARSVKGLRVVNPGTDTQILTLSFGVASADPQEGGEPQELLDRAFKALKRAKEEGRDRVVGSEI